MNSPSAPSQDEIQYEPKAIAALFDDMARTYGVVNLFSSLGLAYRWRKQVVRAIGGDGLRLADLMSGSGEVGALIHRRCRALNCVDIAQNMLERCRGNLARHGDAISFFHEDATKSSLPAQSCDAVTCAFGVKTLDSQGRRRLLDEIHRLLAPTGVASILEFSLPRSPFLTLPFMIYVRYYVPFLGWFFLGNPDAYRRLWVYTKAFSAQGHFHELDDDPRWAMTVRRYFFGCAIHYVLRPQAVTT